MTFHIVSSKGNPTIRGAHGIHEALEIARRRAIKTKKDQWIYILVEKVAVNDFQVQNPTQPMIDFSSFKTKKPKKTKHTSKE